MEEDTLSAFANPCELVRSTCRRWMDNEGLAVETDAASQTVAQPPPYSRSVELRRDKLPALADEILAQHQIAEAHQNATTMATVTSSSSSSSSSSWIKWDEEGWHYSGEGFEGTNVEKRERIALYLLALDAINFCFWPLPETAGKHQKDTVNRLEYEHLAMAMKKMAEVDHGNGNGNGNYVFSPQNLASMTVETMTSLFDSNLDPEKYPLPNISKRAELWKEVGEGLLTNFNGSASALLEASDRDASKLVELVATTFPGFRDETYVPVSPQPQPRIPQGQRSDQGQRIVFLKRAQIFVGDVDAALHLMLRGMGRLTTFADYRVPQILRHKGVLEYTAGLAANVDQNTELAQGSCDEVSIRASTVVAVEELVVMLNQRHRSRDSESDERESESGSNVTEGDGFTDVTVDWYLWQVGERMHQEGVMKPFHKVQTHFY